MISHDHGPSRSHCIDCPPLPTGTSIITTSPPPPFTRADDYSTFIETLLQITLHYNLEPTLGKVVSVLTEAKVVPSIAIMFIVMHFMLCIVDCSYFLMSVPARITPGFLRITHLISAGLYCLGNPHRSPRGLFRVTARCASSAAIALYHESGFTHLLQCFAVNIGFSFVMFK
jgi:hypothetical protein